MKWVISIFLFDLLIYLFIKFRNIKEKFQNFKNIFQFINKIKGKRIDDIEKSISDLMNDLEVDEVDLHNKQK